MPLATRIARSLAGRGQDPEDLNQVAMLEPVRAAGRFDPTRGPPSHTTPTPALSAR
jgi:RNA polymerase sigma-B factor